MKNFKKLLLLIFVAVFAIVLIGCGNKANPDKDKLNEMADKIYLGNTEEIVGDMTLPKYAFGNKEFSVTWESSDTSVIEVKEGDETSYLGSVTLADEAKNVTLTATVKYKDLSTTRKFEITVLADEYEGYENIAAVKAKDGKEKDVSKVKFSGTVSFTTKSGFGVSDGSASIYCYQSSHGRTVGEEVEVRGVWTYYNNMVQIASGCVVKLLGTDADFDIANLAEEKTVSEIFDNKAVETVDPVNCTKIYKTTFVAKNSTGDYNKYCLADPTDNSKYIDLSKYNDSETIDYVGGLVEEGKFYEGIVIIYCSRSAGAAGLWDVLLVPSTVKEVEVELTDAQIVSGILNDLNSLNGKKVKADLELPTTHTSGATISWVSDKEDVISAAGVYTAPDANTEVKLTATVVLNDETQTVEITVMAVGKVKTVANLVTNPVAGVAYKLGIEQLTKNVTIFATGAMSGYYGATTVDHADAIDVYLENVEGGFYVYTTIGGAKKYICAVVSGTYINFKYLDEPNVPWTYNSEYNTITCTVDEQEVFIGTKDTHETFGGYAIATIANGFPAHFYIEEEVKPYATSPVVGAAYKLGIDQQQVEKVLYANGAMSSYYGATTEVYSEGIDVLFEETEGGYYIYTTIEGAKKYVSVVVDGSYKNFKYLDEPSNVWVFNSEFNTVVTTIGEFELFIGTRGTYTTVSVYETKELADDFPVHFYTMDPNAGTEEPEPDPEPVVDEYVKEVEVGKAYKFFIEQGNKNVTLYFVGTMNGYYGATTETRSEGVDVFFEVNGEGYSLYFMVEGAKKYIVATSSEKDGKTYRNFAIADEASTVWTFDTTHYTLTTVVAEENCYMGTYDQNVTFGVSKMSYISTSFPARFALAEGGSVTPDPDPEPTPEVIDATVTEVLEAAKDLADGQTLKDKYTTSGTVTEITSAYNAENKNVSFKLSDGTNEILCYKVVGDEAVNVKVGDTITLTGDIKNYKGTIEFVNATIIERKAGEVTPDPDPEPNPDVNSETLEIYANTGKFDADAKKITWEGENFVFLNEQGSNNNAIRTQDADHFRVYQGNITTLSSKNGAAFTKIVITTTESSYATKLVESEFSAGATATADGKVVTIVVEEGVTEVVITASAQWRLDKVEFVVGDEEVTPDPDPEPTPDPEPVVDEYVKEVEVGKAYKFFIEQGNLSKKIYFNGSLTSNGYYGASTEDKEEAVDVFLESNGDGYSLYFMNGEVKKYIVAVISGTHFNFAIADAASTVWTFDTTNYTLTCVLNESTCYMGTYATYNTFSVSTIDKIATSFPARFELVEKEEVTPDPDPETPVVPDEPEDEYVGPFENEIPGFEPGYVMKEGTITEVLEAVAALKDGETSNYKYKVTGKVVSITEAYSTQYKNVSFMLENGESSILCFRYKGEDAPQIAVGDTITLVGLIKNYKGTLEFVDFTITERVAAPVEPEEPEIPVEPDLPYVTKVEVGKAYKFFIDQTNTGKTLYFAGTKSGNFGASTETKEDGVNMYFEAVEGGYNVWFIIDGSKQYFNAVVSGSYVNISLDATASTIWVFDTTNYALTTVISGTTYYVGTYSTYNTFSISKISFISTSFPGRFKLAVTDEPEEPETPVVPEEPETPVVPEEPTGEIIVLDFVSTFNTYASSWTNSYSKKTLTNQNLNCEKELSVELSNVSKQTGTITDRPVMAAKANTQYVTVKLESGNIKSIKFDLQQWTTKTFNKIVIEYFDGTNWVECSSSITVPAPLTSNELSDGVTQVRLVISTTNSKNVQVGLSSITLIVE